MERREHPFYYEYYNDKVKEYKSVKKINETSKKLDNKIYNAII